MGTFTVGIEEEYQLVCAETAELRSHARDADLPELVRWLSGEALVGVGLDRRSAQREACV